MANKNLFTQVEATRPKKNVFDLSHDVKLSLNMGELVPVMCMEAIPGDKFKCSVESLIRFQPLVSPMMHRCDVTFHTYFVPNRLLWPNWSKFITNTKVAGVLPAVPKIVIGESAPDFSRLCDYLGLPTPYPACDNEEVSALPLAAYQLIYDEYYRDQNLITSEWVPLTDGLLLDPLLKANLLKLRTRAWQHDYFTSALPFAQKGDPVTLPNGDITLKDPFSPDNIPGFKEATGGYPSGPTNILQRDPSGTQIQIEGSANPGMALAYDPNGSLQTEATTINDLRRANALQRFLEKMARGGSRLTEMIWNIFGVKNPDARLQRPEYITGSKSPVVISEILNTTGDTGAPDPLPQGNMSGHGIAVANGNYGGYFVQEHGYFVTIMSVLPQTAYQQGIPKHFTKTIDPYQYFFPDFANIGEQEILTKEIWAYDSPTSETVFGYTPRYAEYKYEPNRVCGDMRSSLDFWHMGRIFANPPLLNQSFIEADPTHRVFAVIDPAEQKLIAHVYNKVKAVRGMPYFGTPTM